MMKQNPSTRLIKGQTKVFGKYNTCLSHTITHKTSAVVLLQSGCPSNEHSNILVNGLNTVQKTVISMFKAS